MDISPEGGVENDVSAKHISYGETVVEEEEA